MGYDAQADLIIGCQVNLKKLYKTKYVKVKPPVTHQEKHFSPKSGRRLKDRTVIDVESFEYFEYKGKEYEDADAFLSAVADELDLDFVCAGTNFEDRYLCPTGSVDTPSDLVYLIKKLPETYRVLTHLGIPVEEPIADAILTDSY